MRWVERGGRLPLFGGARGPLGPHGQPSTFRDSAVLHSWHYGERQRSIGNIKIALVCATLPAYPFEQFDNHEDKSTREIAAWSKLILRM